VLRGEPTGWNHGLAAGTGESLKLADCFVELGKRCCHCLAIAAGLRR
jgi:hypothetical protein